MSSAAPDGHYRHQDGSGEREVSTMAASISIEQESGTFGGRVHHHNGYYAGDFGTVLVAPAAWHAPIPAFDPEAS